MRRVLEAFSTNGEHLPRVAEQTRHEAVRRAELAEAEVEHLTDQLGTAQQDLADETARADAAEREVARLRQELECARGEAR